MLHGAVFWSLVSTSRSAARHGLSSNPGPRQQQEVLLKLLYAAQRFENSTAHPPRERNGCSKLCLADG